MGKEKRQIAVIGGRVADKEALKAAEDIGRLIAENGWKLICGGMGGVMREACKGAFKADGDTIGILPTKNNTKANKYVKTAIATGIGIARNSIIAHSADGAIAVSGKYGTLSEIAYFLQLGKPVVLLHCQWDIDGALVAGFPDEAIEILKAALSAKKQG